MILIVAIQNDLHALTVAQLLDEKGEDCGVVECDRISATHCLNIAVDSSGPARASIRLADGRRLDVDDVDLIWWRRVRSDQHLDLDQADSDARQLVNNDCRGALEGLLTVCCRGRWISSPAATDRASNKLVQLEAARRSGFRVPHTLVTQSYDAVADFCRRTPRVIVKPVVGTAGPLLFTQFVDPSRLDPASCQVAPAIYQEYIAGTQHVRLNCFGDLSVAAVIESADLDWRPNLNVPIRPYAVSAGLHKSVRAVLDMLGLEMGIVDLKVTPEGEHVWLEVNPQGQFLFLEGLMGIPLAEQFAEYLRAEARTARRGSAQRIPAGKMDDLGSRNSERRVQD